MQINIKIILDATQILKMKQENKNLIAKRIEIIHKLFDNFQLMRKKIENIKSKNLVNNQIYEEVKRRINENKKFLSNTKFAIRLRFEENRFFRFDFYPI